MLGDGQLIRFYRVRAELTQAELAGLLGTHRSCINKYETGKTCPTTGRILRIAMFLGIHPHQLFPRLRGTELKAGIEQPT